MMKLARLLIIPTVAIALFILIKYRPAYKVFIGETEVGYVPDKLDLEYTIQEEILKAEQENIAFITLDEEISYKLEFVTNAYVNKEEVVAAISENTKSIYKIYEVANDTEKIYAHSMEEANTIIEELKTKYAKSNSEIEFGIQEIYTDNIEQLESQEENITKLASAIEARKEDVVQRTEFNGVSFTTIPTIGRISSRFGSRESIRTSAHKGIDIAAKNGTTIKAAADGIVTTAGYNSGGYGNLVVIDHGNGVETYYGHCSKLLVKKGQTVSAGDSIGLVGSTGRSTGNHLHFEIRLDDKQINPQLYVYK